MSAEEESVNFEQRLRAVAPPAANVNRDRLMFAAGAAAERAVVRRTQRGWQIAAGSFAATAAALALVLGLRPPTETMVAVEPPEQLSAKIVVAAAPAEDSPASLPDERHSAGMFHLRGLALQGVWDDPQATEPVDSSRAVTPTSLPRFDWKKAAGDPFPIDGRM